MFAEFARQRLLPTRYSRVWGSTFTGPSGSCASFLQVHFRAKRVQLKRFDAVLTESQGHNWALNVLYVPCSLDRGTRKSHARGELNGLRLGAPFTTESVTEALTQRPLHVASACCRGSYTSRRNKPSSSVSHARRFEPQSKVVFEDFVNFWR